MLDHVTIGNLGNLWGVSVKFHRKVLSVIWLVESNSQELKWHLSSIVSVGFYWSIPLDLTAF
jgi:hypothetical protein